MNTKPPDHTRVRVCDAPGFPDFDADLVMETKGPDNRPQSIVAYERGGKREVTVVPSSCVTPVRKS